MTWRHRVLHPRRARRIARTEQTARDIGLLPKQYVAPIGTTGPRGCSA